VRVRREEGRLGKMRELRYYVFVSNLEGIGMDCRTSINSPRSSASEACGLVIEVEIFLSGSDFVTDLAVLLSFGFFFACLFCLGFRLSIGAARALRTGSLKQSRNVS
jgi:hypothetical protein